MDAGPWILGRVRPSLLYSALAALSWPVVRWLYRLRAEGKENLPHEGGYVLAANHSSNLDPWPLGVPLWPGRFLRFMAKSELYWWPLGHLINAGGGFPVRRGEHDLEAIETAVDLARKGIVDGIAVLRVQRVAVLIDPRVGRVRVRTGSGRIRVPAERVVAGLGPLRVRYGKPIPLDDLKDEDPALAANEATERLMAEIDRLGAGL